jgi:phosphate transport system ATP-binding protein
MDVTTETPPPVRRLEPGSTLTVRSSRVSLTDLREAPSAVGTGRRVLELDPGEDETRDAGDQEAEAGEWQPAFLARASQARPRVPSIERMRAEDVTIRYGERQAVRSVSLPVRQGEVLALIGPSGCGKTTLLRSFNRLTELTKSARLSGRITLDGGDISDLEPTALRRRVTMVFQQPNPFPMSIFDNVAYVLREQARRRPRRQVLRPQVEEALARAGLLEEVKDDLDHPALRLSGGQQQRLCIARALAAQPEVLLLDEPCSALDPQSSRVIEDLIVRLREEVAIVIVTHNLQQAHRVGDRVAFMYLGELVEYGTAQALFGNPTQQRTREYVSGAFG